MPSAAARPQKFPPTPHSVILNRYKLRRKIAADYDSYVFSAQDLNASSKTLVAVKVAPLEDANLLHEKKMYAFLRGCPAIVKVLDSGPGCLVRFRG